MDFVKGLPKSDGKEVILVVVDRLSKYVHFKALTHPYTATLVAKAFIDNVYKLHGFPATIVNDRDTMFQSQFWKSLFVCQGVDLHYSIAYHPQSNDQIEVVNKCVESYLRCMRNDTFTQWSKWLPLCECWYNINYHTLTKHTPYEVLYGLMQPIHIPCVPKDLTNEIVDKLLSNKEEMLKIIRNNLQVV